MPPLSGCVEGDRPGHTRIAGDNCDCRHEICVESSGSTVPDAGEEVVTEVINVSEEAYGFDTSQPGVAAAEALGADLTAVGRPLRGSAL